MSDINGSSYQAHQDLEFHCHSEDEMKSGTSEANKAAMKKLGLACFLVGLFMFCEIIGG